MSFIKYRVRANDGFHDGNVYPTVIQRGAVVDVDEDVYKKMLQSDPDGIELLEKVIPNPKRKKEE
jgi:hypothetical protein